MRHPVFDTWNTLDAYPLDMSCVLQRFGCKLALSFFSPYGDARRGQSITTWHLLSLLKGINAAFRGRHSLANSSCEGLLRLGVSMRQIGSMPARERESWPICVYTGHPCLISNKTTRLFQSL